MNRGQGLVEYTLFIGLTGILLILIIWAIGQGVSNLPVFQVDETGVEIFRQILFGR